MHRAGAALAEPAAEARIAQAEVVPQRIQQRHVGIVDLDDLRLAIDVKLDLHGRGSPLCRQDITKWLL